MSNVLLLMQDTDQTAYEDNRSGRAAQGNGKEKINTTQKINFKRS